jgi:CDP-glucose 4,6-dehydratase
VKSPEPSFWQGRRVFVTGHTGFKGSWLCLWLHAVGAKVYGYSDCVPTTPSHFETAKITELLVQDTRGDVCCRSGLQAALEAADAEVVFHLAAQPLVSIGYRDPVRTFEVNVNGTLNLLECVRLKKTPATVIIVTSDKCYAPADQSVALRESDPMGGLDPYSSSKSVAELISACYRYSFFSGGTSGPIRVATVRAGNVIGGGDWASNRLIPDAARQLSQKQSLVLRNPAAIRPWQHVLEPLSGYLMLAEKLSSADGGRFAEGWNFGPLASDAVPVHQVAEWFADAWGAGEVLVDTGQSIGRETGVLRLAIDKAMSGLGWRPVWCVRDAVTRAANWYRDFYDSPRSDVRSRSLSEIDNFTRQADRST